jgi:hypothetical protein
MESGEWLGDVTSKSTDRFVFETVRKRIRNLLALNVPRRQAIRHGKSRKGPWHMAKTIASGVGMTHAWLAEQGVLRHESLWTDFGHFLKSARLQTRMPWWYGEVMRKRASLPDFGLLSQ